MPMSVTSLEKREESMDSRKVDDALIKSINSSFFVVLFLSYVLASFF
jgi:hypothetical protein